MAIELSAHYYHDNFNDLVGFVNDYYGDILPPATRRWLDSYGALSESAQRLFVRLISRTHEHIRLDAIDYPELGSTDKPLVELSSRKLIQESAPPVEALLRLATKAELLALVNDKTIKTKAAAMSAIQSSVDTSDVIKTSLVETTQPVSIDKHPHLDLLCIAYFANPYQNLSEFIIADVGVRTPPKWPLSKERRVFKSTEQLEAHLALAQHAEYFHDRRRELSVTQLQHLASELPTALDSIITRRRERLLFNIARQIERLGAINSALEMYTALSSYEAWERGLRCLHALGQSKRAFEALLNAEYQHNAFWDFKRRFQPQLERSLSMPKSTFEKFAPDQVSVVIKRTDDRVEQCVIDDFERQGDYAVYAENQIVNTLVALAFWKVISADREGAFFNPYQFAPADVHGEDFLTSRMEEFKEEAQNLTKRGVSQVISERYHLLHGYRAMLLHCECLTCEEWVSIAEQWGAQRLVDLARYLLSDVRERRSGQPDLIVKGSDGSWQFVEVKGPGDQLQDHQRSWMKFFAHNDIAAKLLWVNYES